MGKKLKKKNDGKIAIDTGKKAFCAHVVRLKQRNWLAHKYMPNL